MGLNRSMQSNTRRLDRSAYRELKWHIEGRLSQALLRPRAANSTSMLSVVYRTFGKQFRNGVVDIQHLGPYVCGGISTVWYRLRAVLPARWPKTGGAHAPAWKGDGCRVKGDCVEWGKRRANGLTFSNSLECSGAAAQCASAAVLAAREIFRRAQLSRSEAHHAHARSSHRMRE